MAIQTAASSGAHLTKYSNITDVRTGQKKLIVDDAIVPARAVFDYGVTASAPRSLTVDGALDGISHSLEVLYSAVGKPYYPLMEEVAGRASAWCWSTCRRPCAIPRTSKPAKGSAWPPTSAVTPS